MYGKPVPVDTVFEMVVTGKLSVLVPADAVVEMVTGKVPALVGVATDVVVEMVVTGKLSVLVLVVEMVVIGNPSVLVGDATDLAVVTGHDVAEVTVWQSILSVQVKNQH